MNATNLEAKITRQPVTSSQITSVGYDAATETLEIEFTRGGSVYRYSGVSQDTMKAMLTAESVGSFFYKNIKLNPTKYPYAKVS